jgi:GMP synthase (glutamine-hydrolysing)
MKQALALRHVAFEDLGTLGPVLAGRGYGVEYREAGDGLAGLDPLAPDLLVVLGGPIGACDDALYPFVGEEAALLARRLAAGRPTLGICLGAQLMARALGARVYPGPAAEIGWAPLALTAAGAASPVRHLAGDRTSMFHWHGDTFDLPAGATLLASTAAIPHQVYSHGRHALAFQCHPELAAGALEQWLIGHAVELGQAGVDPRTLRAETARHAAALAAAAARCLGEWLDRADTPP